VKNASLVLAVVIAVACNVVSAQEESELKRDLKAVPALLTLNLPGENLALVGKGSCLVNVIGCCNGCHTVDIAPYLAGGDPFANEPEAIGPDLRAVRP